MGPARFDAQFFHRYYRDPSTRVADETDGARVAALIAAVLGYFRLPVRDVLDVGCGVGRLREPLAAQFPGARYQGLEVSRYLCRRYGWQHGSLVDYSPGRTFDLVICHDVTQYLDDRDAVRGLANLARLSGAALYFSALTRGDWRANADQARTDGAVHLRGRDWYERRIKRSFRHLGLGVHLKRGFEPIVWELERPWR
jgi:2-polyprenyl-3-methyl-5-hydroxy-6-metoxy-1,4-benzoquinol methylase